MRQKLKIMKIEDKDKIIKEDKDKIIKEDKDKIIKEDKDKIIKDNEDKIIKEEKDKIIKDKDIENKETITIIKNDEIENATQIMKNGKESDCIYSVIEIYDYETSQNEYALGFKNPIEEFKNICEDFEIEFKNDFTNVDYGKAVKIKLTSFMLWGTKDGLKKFFNEKNITLAKSYFFEGEKKEQGDFFLEKKTGIYLYINRNTKLAYIIIWPGNISYKYSRMDEPNDNLLLTLVRFGFSLSSNSILCLSDKEIDNFEPKGYENLENSEKQSGGFASYQLNINEKRFFSLEKEKYVDPLQGLKIDKISNYIIKQNDFLCYFQNQIKEMKTQKEGKEVNEFIKICSSYDFYFDVNFNIPDEFFYLLIRSKRKILDAEKNKLYYDSIGLIDILKDLINKNIDESFESFLKNIIDDNYENNLYCCKFCNETNNFGDLYALDENEYSHKSCYNNFFGENFPKDTCKIKDIKNTENFNLFKKTILENKNHFLIDFFPL